ncbi:MAG: D-glycerate dehydrogenase [Candidatus Aminicenantes bacterium]|nr:D-glycerate dehydrogenase [Candidatus Aminicenantes bacterium]
MKPKVLITRKIFDEALKILNGKVTYTMGPDNRSLTSEELCEKIKDKEGLFCLLTDKIDRNLIDAAPGLKVIANCAVGYDNIDVPYALKKGITVTNTPGILTETTADLTWALLLATARRIPGADRFCRMKHFKGWKLDLFLGQEVTGKQLGIIGMGRIGRAVAGRARAFLMDVVYSDPHRLPQEEEASLGAVRVPLDYLLSDSDFVTVHADLNSSTRHLISREKIKLMKKSSILINVSRGPIVDEKALTDALEGKKIWAAGLDVFEREPEIEEKLHHLDNVVLLPHIGSATFATRIKMAVMAARNLVQVLEGKTPDNPVHPD